MTPIYTIFTAAGKHRIEFIIRLPQNGQFSLLICIGKCIMSLFKLNYKIKQVRQIK
jgi:hypothetical protein